SLQVELTLQQENGTRITKRFIFHRGKYRVDMEYIVDNQSEEPWRASLYGQIKRDSHEPDAGSGGIGMKPFVGAALTTNEDRYRKFSFDDITDEYKGSGKEDNSFSTRVQGGWVS